MPVDPECILQLLSADEGWQPCLASEGSLWWANEALNKWCWEHALYVHFPLDRARPAGLSLRHQVSRTLCERMVEMALEKARSNPGSPSELPDSGQFEPSQIQQRSTGSEVQWNPPIPNWTGCRLLKCLL